MQIANKFILSFCLILFLGLTPLLSLSTIGGSTEAREAHVAQLILDFGDWGLPLRNGLVPSKPPLYHWLAAITSMSSGLVSPIKARLPSTAAACLIVLLTFQLAKNIAQKGSKDLSQRSLQVGLSACVILVCCYGFISLAMDCRVDMVFSAFVVLAVTSICLALVRGNFESNNAWNAFWIACGLGVLAKGPIGLVLPAWIVFCLLCQQCGLRIALRTCFRPRLVWLIFALICLPWYLLAWYRHTGAFLERQLLFENIFRVIGREDINTEVWWFYIPSVLRTAAPWSIVFFYISLASLQKWLAPIGQAPATFLQFARFLQLPVVWFWSGLLLFTLASGKRHSYLLPLYSALSVAVSVYGYDFYLTRSQAMRLEVSRHFAKLPEVFIFLSLLFLCSLWLIHIPAFPSGSATEIQAWIVQKRHFISLYGAAILVLFLIAGVFDGLWRVVVRSVLVCLSLSLILAIGMGSKNHLKWFDVAANRIIEVAGQRASILCVRGPKEEFFDALLYYIRRPVHLQAVGQLDLRGIDFVIAFSDDQEAVKQAAGKIGKIAQLIDSFRTLNDWHRQRKDFEYQLLQLEPIGS